MFGPPDGVTRPSPCPWVDHKVSRLLPPTERPVQTRFPFGFVPIVLSLADESNSPDHYAKGTPSPRRAPTAVYAHGFSCYFTPLTGEVFTFQSPYCFTIGCRGVLSLGGWTPHIHAGFHGPDTTLGLRRSAWLQGYHLLRPRFPARSPCSLPSAFARRYLRSLG